jgi:hypothetical protein
MKGTASVRDGRARPRQRQRGCYGSLSETGRPARRLLRSSLYSGLAVLGPPGVVIDRSRTLCRCAGGRASRLRTRRHRRDFGERLAGWAAARYRRGRGLMPRRMWSVSPPSEHENTSPPRRKLQRGHDASRTVSVQASLREPAGRAEDNADHEWVSLAQISTMRIRRRAPRPSRRERRRRSRPTPRHSRAPTTLAEALLS